MRDPIEIAASFVRRWQIAWNADGGAAVAMLYADDAVLVGAAIAVGRPAIARALSALHNQGWTTIDIRIVNARLVAGVVVLACEFTATGTSTRDGKSLDGRSGYILTECGGTWLATMHAAA